MLKGIDTVLTGDLLKLLDHMGHSDLVVVADANFPAYRLGPPVIDVAVDCPRAVRAIATVMDMDDVDGASLMVSPDGWLPVQREIMAELGVSDSEVTQLGRHDFYVAAARANLIVRTSEARIYANVLLSKGVVKVSE